MKFITILLSLILLFSCKNDGNKTIDNDPKEDIITYEAISLLGDTLRSAQPSEELLERLDGHRERYTRNPDSLDLLIWYGRFTAYSGAYKEAISIYTDGLEKFPDESRLLRHRGHRYISIREFDKAIADLSHAADLIEGKENSMEEDGMPNARNIPVSSKHGNIYYHLGLAYYLKQDFPNALRAYQKCLQTSGNPDNVVSSTHWIYMILRRMGREIEAVSCLSDISVDMDIIENQAYQKACLLYKGTLDINDVLNEDGMAASASSALKYGIGNWYYYNDDHENARKIFSEIVSGEDWASFGYIAAEADLLELKASK